MMDIRPSPEMQRLITIHDDMIFHLQQRLNLGAIVDKFYAELRADPSLWQTARRSKRLNELLSEAFNNEEAGLPHYATVESGQ